MRTSSRIRLKYKRRNRSGGKSNSKSFREKIQVFIKLVLIIKNILKIHCISKKSDNKKSDNKKSDNKKSK